MLTLRDRNVGPFPRLRRPRLVAPKKKQEGRTDSMSATGEPQAQRG